jgi:hypothetical protein
MNVSTIETVLFLESGAKNPIYFEQHIYFCLLVLLNMQRRFEYNK